MTRFQLAISLAALALSVGCGDRSGECPSNDCDGSVDNGDDGGEDQFSATIVAAIPFDGVEVTVDDAQVICDVDTLACVHSVNAPGSFDVEAWDTYTFVPKTVDVNDPGEFRVSWAEGGCASDPDWDATGPCDEWEPGEYGLTPLEGSYTDEIWGRGADITIAFDDGSVVIENITGSSDATMSGHTFYGSTDSGVWWTGTIIDEETFSMTKLNGTTGSVDEFLFHRD